MTDTGAADESGMALGRCVSDRVDFLNRQWGKMPVYTPAVDASAFRDLASMQAVDGLISSGSLRVPDLRVVKDGADLDSSSYLKPSRRSTGLPPNTADSGRVYAHFDAGATIVLQGLHRYSGALRDFCRDLELALTHPVQANAYVTPKSAKGLGRHADSHDVFVLQFFGRKRWEVYEPANEAGETAKRVLAAELAAGDALYIPAGFPHAARTLDSPSAHLTIGVLAFRWGDVIRAAMRQAIDVLDDSLPPGFARDPQKLERLVADKLNDLRHEIEQVDAAELAAATANQFWASRPAILDGQLHQLLTLERLTDDSVVRRRIRGVCRMKVTGDSLYVLLGDRQLEMPARLEPLMRWIVSRKSFTVRELTDHLDESSRLVLAKRLIREGFLELVND